MNKIKKYLTSMLLIFTCSLIFIAIQSNVSYADSPSIKFNQYGKFEIKETVIKDGEEQKQNLTGKKDTLNTILTKTKSIVVFLSAIGSLTVIACFILNFINLGHSKGNPEARKKAISGLIVCGIATAGLGSVTLITQLFYNMIRDDIEW